MSEDEDGDPDSFGLPPRKHALDRALSLLDNEGKSPPPAPIFKVARPSSNRPAGGRERGRVRVDPLALQSNSSCSRHCSPPPAEPEPLKAASPGPRDGRAGSPAPAQETLSDLEDSADDGTCDEGESGAGGRRASAVAAGRDESALLSDSSDEEPRRGLRQMLRRASEHIPAFHRRSFRWTLDEGTTGCTSNGSEGAQNGVLRARSMSAGPLHVGRSHGV